MAPRRSPAAAPEFQRVRRYLHVSPHTVFIDRGGEAGDGAVNPGWHQPADFSGPHRRLDGEEVGDRHGLALRRHWFVGEAKCVAQALDFILGRNALTRGGRLGAAHVAGWTVRKPFPFLAHSRKNGEGSKFSSRFTVAPVAFLCPVMC